MFLAVSKLEIRLRSQLTIPGGVCSFFTRNRSFYRSTFSTPIVRADVDSSSQEQKKKKKKGCLRRIWLGSVSCSLFPTQTNPKPTKNYFAVGKSGPLDTFDLGFRGLGWPWVGEFVGFKITFDFGKTQIP